MPVGTTYMCGLASWTKPKRFCEINSVDHIWLGEITTTLGTLLIYYKAIYQELNLLLSVWCSEGVLSP